VIKLIIFDLDGTLVNTAADVTNALNYSIEPYPIEKMTVEKTIGMVGEGITRLIEKLLGEGRRAIMPDVLDRFLCYYSEHLLDFSLPYPGVLETLERLAGYKKGVISNKREGLSKRLLEELGLSHYFDIILGSDSVDERKPSPKPILHIMGLLKVGPEDAVMVGDSQYDIQAGKAAGIGTIAVTYGYREKRLLASADLMIDRMEDLLPALEKFNQGKL
jgi:phosphoglycolate phosphatase